MSVKPIKKLDRIEAMKQELEKRTTKGDGQKVYFEGKRNRAIFCTGINTALRVSDICKLDLKDIFNEDLTFKDVKIVEQKTKKTKCFPINDSLREELKAYIECYFYTIFRIPIMFGIKEDDKEKIKEIIKTQPLFPSERGRRIFIKNSSI